MFIFKVLNYTRFISFPMIYVPCLHVLTPSYQVHKSCIYVLKLQWSVFFVLCIFIVFVFCFKLFAQKNGVGVDMADSARISGAGDQNVSIVKKYQQENSNLVQERSQLLKQLEEAYVTIEQVEHEYARRQL